jgi:hypothetical protein
MVVLKDEAWRLLTGYPQLRPAQAEAAGRGALLSRAVSRDDPPGDRICTANLTAGSLGRILKTTISTTADVTNN